MPMGLFGVLLLSVLTCGLSFWSCSFKTVLHAFICVGYRVVVLVGAELLLTSLFLSVTKLSTRACRMPMSRRSRPVVGKGFRPA